MPTNQVGVAAQLDKPVRDEPTEPPKILQGVSRTLVRHGLASDKSEDKR